MINVRGFFSAVSVTLAALFVSCGKDDNPADASKGPIGVTNACSKVIIETYSLSFPAADSVVAIRAAHTDTVSSCLGATRTETPVAVPADTDYYHYRLATNNDLEWRDDSLIPFIKTVLRGLRLVDIDSVDFFLVFSRHGGGPGLNGIWRLDSAGYRDTIGALNMIEKVILDSIIKAWIVNDTSNDDEYVEISGSTMSVFRVWKAADEFMEEWAKDSAGYAITAVRINDCTLQLMGTISGEVVTISGDGRGNTVFRTNKPDEMPEHTYYPENPRACPNTKMPSWWQTFLDHNVRSPQ